MPCNEWFEIEKRYRIAVHAYCDAVDRLDSARDVAGEWTRIDNARLRADQMRLALVKHQRKHACLTQAASDHFLKVAGAESEDLVLGDVGQLGG